jgi:hypothetical protein
MEQLFHHTISDQRIRTKTGNFQKFSSQKIYENRSRKEHLNVNRNGNKTCAGQYCGSGSGRIGIILADPGPDPFPFQPNVKLNYTWVFFPRKFKNPFQNIDQLCAYLSDGDEQDKKM